ncbi:MAG: zinc-dependent metalloprotease [Actinomycetota bacterium]|nr:zinc-dependent metalloprotease [Actinomycetota bacterium]
MARLIEPRIAVAVARRVAGSSEIDDSFLLERLKRDLSDAVPRSEQLVAEFSGIPAPPPVDWGIIDRATWAEVNIKGMTALLAPIHEKIGRRLDSVPLPARLLQTTAVSAEIGLLLGYISKRVLGQYDLLVSEEAAPTPASRRGTAPGPNLYFVGPNMVETERRFGFVPEEFALWVALHEVTHRFQFEGVPWLRPRFLSLVHDYLGTVDLDAKGLAQRLAGAGRKLVSRSIPSEEKSPMYLLASDEQKKVLDEIQALMAVIEGHGNFVMDAIGERVIPSFRQMRHVFQRRRQQQTVVQRVVAQAIGLEMKLRQYELGQAFCEGVAAQGGVDALRHLWVSESHFPTLVELRAPASWLTRVAA